MLPFMLTDAMACLISSFDPCLDLYFMLQIIMLFACVGRWSTLRPTLDAGVSSVLLFYLFILAAMLECCFLLSYIPAPCMCSGVWLPWQLCLSLHVSFQVACWLTWVLFPYFLIHAS